MAAFYRGPKRDNLEEGTGIRQLLMLGAILCNDRSTRIGLAAGWQSYSLRDSDFDPVFPAGVNVDALSVRADILWSTKRLTQAKKAEFALQGGGFLFARNTDAHFSSTPPAYYSPSSTSLLCSTNAFHASLGLSAILGVESDKFAVGFGMNILLVGFAKGTWERTEIVDPVSNEPETVTRSEGSFSKFLVGRDLGGNSLPLNDVSFRFSYTFGR